ncbi:MAG: hypothetical protein IJC16_00035 [Rikenellaceae bacterium]|nr:hypothetical protein [Rikenellaceae bacterium]
MTNKEVYQFVNDVAEYCEEVLSRECKGVIRNDTGTGANKPINHTAMNKRTININVHNLIGNLVVVCAEDAPEVITEKVREVLQRALNAVTSVDQESCPENRE